MIAAGVDGLVDMDMQMHMAAVAVDIDCMTVVDTADWQLGSVLLTGDFVVVVAVLPIVGFVVVALLTGGIVVAVVGKEPLVLLVAHLVFFLPSRNGSVQGVPLVRAR